MDVERPAPRQREERGRQHVAVGGGDAEVGLEGGQRLEEGGVARRPFGFALFFGGGGGRPWGRGWNRRDRRGKRLV